MYQSNTLYALNLHNISCQNLFNKKFLKTNTITIYCKKPSVHIKEIGVYLIELYPFLCPISPKLRDFFAQASCYTMTSCTMVTGSVPRVRLPGFEFLLLHSHAGGLEHIEENVSASVSSTAR